MNISMCFTCHDTRRQRFTHTLVHGFPYSILHLQHKFHIQQAMNATDVGQRGYESVPNAAFCTTGLALFGWKQSIGEGTIPLTLDPSCRRIVEPFKHLLYATAHSQSLVHELQAPMGTCQGQYSTCAPVFYPLLPDYPSLITNLPCLHTLWLTWTIIVRQNCLGMRILLPTSLVYILFFVWQ